MLAEDLRPNRLGAERRCWLEFIARDQMIALVWSFFRRSLAERDHDNHERIN